MCHTWGQIPFLDIGPKLAADFQLKQLILDIKCGTKIKMRYLTGIQWWWSRAKIPPFFMSIMAIALHTLLTEFDLLTTIYWDLVYLDRGSVQLTTIYIFLQNFPCQMGCSAGCPAQLSQGFSRNDEL